MSWFSNALHGVGHLAEKAAPYAGLIPGVGTLAGAAIGGLGGLAAGDGLGGALKYGALGAAGGYGGAALRGLGTGAKIAAVGGSLLRGGVPSAGGAAAPAGDPSNPMDPGNGNYLYGSDTAPGGQAGAPAAGGIGGYLSSALGGINPLTGALAGAEVVNAGQLGAKANQYANQAYGSAAGSYAERAGLRKQGIAGMLNPQTPDLTGLTAIRGRNPYAPPPPGVPTAQAPAMPLNRAPT